MNEPTSLQQARCMERTLSLNYLLFLPECYGQDPNQRWPMILFLHGAGERGEDLELVKKHGIAKIVEERPDFPFVSVSPQCPEGMMWWEFTSMLVDLVEEITTTHAVDSHRVYLTGLSMGGYGTWHLALVHPQRFAAIAPICGGGLSEFVMPLKDLPVWAFHGDADESVPLSAGQRMVDALKNCGGNVRFTVYPGTGHDSWTQTYENQELYDWFLQHKT